MAIVWSCPLSVDEYVAAGRRLEVPRPNCPSCTQPMHYWSGYERALRVGALDHQLWVPRARCRLCNTTHALLPAFVVLGRLDTAETIGAVLEAVATGPAGVRPAAEAAAVPHSTARGWWRRFARRAEALAAAFAALGSDLGDVFVSPATGPVRRAIAAIGHAFCAACAFPGWHLLGHWRFANAVSGGSFLATNTNPLYLVVGKRRFMPPVP
jgi:transposase-like protein